MIFDTNDALQICIDARVRYFMSHRRAAREVATPCSAAKFREETSCNGRNDPAQIGLDSVGKIICNTLKRKELQSERALPLLA